MKRTLFMSLWMSVMSFAWAGDTAQEAPAGQTAQQTETPAVSGKKKHAGNPLSLSRPKKVKRHRKKQGKTQDN
ncbi:MAG: hypothetical protein LBK01_03750 [Burkholderiaceae bacterium]|jgi:hypothetical protein|nr:hypothetical protein [Burkholderiaceae bacterium]